MGANRSAFSASVHTQTKAGEAGARLGWDTAPTPQLEELDTPSAPNRNNRDESGRFANPKPALDADLAKWVLAAEVDSQPALNASQVRSLLRLEGREWDGLVSGFDGICQEQLFTYASLRWPGLEIEPLIMRGTDGPIGGALVMLQKLPLGVATIALVKWGPFLADNSRPDAEDHMVEMVDALVSEYADRRGMMLSIMPRAAADGGAAVIKALEGRGFVAGVGLPHPGRYVVDVRLDDEARLRAFAQKWRYHLRKAFKADLQFQVGRPDELDRFMVLYDAMRARKRFPDYSAIDTLGALFEMPEGATRPEIFFVNAGEKTVAGGVILTAGDTAIYLYGATNDAALDLRAGYFLHWNVIRWLRDNTSVRFYDLGGTDGYQGLHQFKSGMVGEAGYITDVPPVYNLARRRHVQLVGGLAFEARERVNRFRTALQRTRLSVARHWRKA